MRGLVETQWPELPLDHVSVQAVTSAQGRRQKDRLPDAKTIGTLLPYTDFADAYEIISPRKSELSTQTRSSVDALGQAFDRLVAIRNQVAHTKPMRLDDTAFAADIASQLVRQDEVAWSSLSETMQHIEENPAYVLGLTPVWRIEEPAGTPFNNLPIPEFDETGFFGRREELKKLKRLVKGNYPIVSILGEGGIGKTALVIQAAYDLLDDPDQPFEAIVWVTAKSSLLTSSEIVSITDAIKDSLGLFSQAAQFLGGTVGDPISDLQSYLATFKVLLILDNLETVLDSTLREFLSDIPVGSKVIVTSRISLGMLDNPIHVSPLTPDESVNLLYALCRARGVTQIQGIARDEVIHFVSRMSGHPAYIRWFVAGLQAGRRPEELLGKNDLLLEYCMSNVYEYLESRAREVLQSFQILPGARNMAELAYLNELDSRGAEQVLLELLTTNFVSMSSRSTAGTLESTYFLADFAKGYLDRKHSVSRASRARVLKRSQELRDQGFKFSAEMAASPYAAETVMIRGVEDASVARLLKSALSSPSDEDGLATCREAQQLAPHYSEAFRVEALIRTRIFDISGAQGAFERALGLSDFSSTRYHFGVFLIEQGYDVRRALDLLQEAARADRWSPEIASEIAWAHYLQRDWPLSFASAKQVVDLPRSTFVRRVTALVMAIRATCQRVEHELSRQRSDLALEAAEEAIGLCEGVKPDLLSGECADLLRLLHALLKDDFRNFSGYYLTAAIRAMNALVNVTDQAEPGKRRLISVIVRVVPEKGFAFVAATPKDYFLHVSELLNPDVWETMEKGERCAFEPTAVDSRWRAANVRLLRL